TRRWPVGLPIGSSLTSLEARVGGLRLAVLVGRSAGDVVAAVGVRAGLPWRQVAVLGLDAGRMGRRRGGLRVASRLELLAEHRHDLATEQLELVEHGVQRQARVVDQEQLALVIAERDVEGQRLVDDRLRAADRQRRHLAEVLERGAVAVDRRVIEVGPKLLVRVLRAPGDIGLAAEADDRLLTSAVTVVLEAPPVELDQTERMRGWPEDVVGKESVAVVRGLLGDLRGPD